MGELIPAPVLDDRDEELKAAQAIASVCGGLTVARAERGIETWRHLRDLLAASAPAPACPELTNADPTGDHIALIEAFATLCGLQSFKINLFPERDALEFLRLHGVALREATYATATLEFSVNAPAGVPVTIPAGTRVGTPGGAYVFETLEELVIPADEVTAATAARRTVVGETSLAPDTLTEMVSLVAFIESVTNPALVDSGSDAETVEAAKARARSYLRRGEHLVSARDVQEAIFYEVLFGNGIVRAFDKIAPGDWEAPKAGHVTAVVMTRAGNPVGAEVKEAINSLLGQMVGHIWVYVVDPTYVGFDVEFNVKLDGLVTQAATLAAVERNLRAFYAPSEGNIGRSILRSEIIAIIEGTDGVARIEPQVGGEILASPAADVDIAPYALPRLDAVTPHVVP